VKEGVQVIRSPEAALADPLLIEDGCVVEVVDPELGPIRHLGTIVEFTKTPGGAQGPAPRRGEHTDAVLAEAAAPRPAADLPAARSIGSGGPLAGVKVLDIGLAAAGPYATSLMADLGADVIKVNAPWDGPWMGMALGQSVNLGKRSVVLNFSKPAGRAALAKLVEQADIVGHNMRFGVAERVGVGYDDLRAINPSIIYCASRGFDRIRSATNVPGTDQSASALGGQEWEDGGRWRGGRPFLGTSMGDLGNGYLSAIACIQALYHRDRTGEGQWVSTSILNACLTTSSGTFIFPDGSGPERHKLDALQLGFNALYRLYETADGWVCLAAVKPDHWGRLCDAVGRSDLAGDDRFADAAARAVNDDELAKHLEEAFAGRSAREWFDVLDAAGVPVEVSAKGFVSPAGDQPFIRFSATPASAPGEPPVMGAHTTEILTAVGLTEAEIDAVRAEAGSGARFGD
jgi:crotonobetainyl-CoA:carnitine CoA-transferase CaiB-like acyl-CoA transferase